MIGTPSFAEGFGAIPDTVNALPDGNILLTSTVTYTTSTDVVDTSLFVEELAPNGSLDTSFGTGGRVQIPINAPSQSFRVGVEPSGQVILASVTTEAPGESRYVALRLNANGSIDTTFGTEGLAEYPGVSIFPTPDHLVNLASVLIESDGKILLAGQSINGFAVVRLNSDGSLDTTYGTGGTATVPVTVNSLTVDEATSATIQPNDQVVLAGTVETYSNNSLVDPTIDTDGAVIRLNADGSLDTTFGGSGAAGIVLLPPDPATPATLGMSRTTTVGLQPSTGDIVVAGINGSRPRSSGSTPAGPSTPPSAPTASSTPASTAPRSSRPTATSSSPAASNMRP